MSGFPYAGDHNSPLVRTVNRAIARAAASEDPEVRMASDMNRGLRALERLSGKPDEEFRNREMRNFAQLLAYGEPFGLVPVMVPTEFRDLGVGTGAAGGYMVPARMADAIVYSVKEWSAIFANCRRIDTTDGAPLTVPVTDDTATVGAINAENASITGLETDVTVSTVTLGAFAYVSKPIKYSWQMASDVAASQVRGDQDANAASSSDRGGFSLLDALGALCGERLGRAIGAHLAAGTGTAQPTGLAVGTTVGVTSATGHTTSVNGLADILALEASVDPAYRSDAAFVMAPATWQSIVGSIETNAGVVFNPFDAQQPPRLLGYRVLLDNSMPALGASAKHTFFGSLPRAYGVRTVGDPAVIVMRERYADQLQGAIVVWTRLDASVLDPKAGRLLANSAT